MRFPGKLLQDLGGVPVVVRVWKRASLAGLDLVVVATDDARIEKAVTDAGGRAVMTSVDLRTGTDRIAAAARLLDGDKASDDVILNIQGDEPFIEPELIGRVAKILVDDPSIEMGTAATPATPEERNNPNAVKVVLGRDGRALYFSRSPIPGVHSGYDGGLKPVTLRHIGLYAYRRSLLERFVTWPPAELEMFESLEQLRALDRGTAIHVIVAPSVSFGIDTPEDLERARAHLAGAESGGGPS